MPFLKKGDWHLVNLRMGDAVIPRRMVLLQCRELLTSNFLLESMCLHLHALNFQGFLCLDKARGTHTLHAHMYIYTQYRL